MGLCLLNIGRAKRERRRLTDRWSLATEVMNFCSLCDVSRCRAPACLCCSCRSSGGIWMSWKGRSSLVFNWSENSLKLAMIVYCFNPFSSKHVKYLLVPTTKVFAATHLKHSGMKFLYFSSLQWFNSLSKWFLFLNTCTFDRPPPLCQSVWDFFERHVKGHTLTCWYLPFVFQRPAGLPYFMMGERTTLIHCRLHYSQPSFSPRCVFDVAGLHLSGRWQHSGLIFAHTERLWYNDKIRDSPDVFLHLIGPEYQENLDCYACSQRLTDRLLMHIIVYSSEFDRL